MTSTSHIPITGKDILAQHARINSLLAKVAWKPQRQVQSSDTPSAKRWLPSAAESSATEEAVSLITTARMLSGNDPALLSNDVNTVMIILRDGLSIGLHLSKAYGQAVSLDVLMQQNRDGRLSSAQQGEFNGKLTMSAVIALFVAASYVVHTLGKYKEEKVSSVRVDFQGLPEVVLREPVSATQCMLYYLGLYWSKSGAVRTELEMIKMTFDYMRAVLDDIKNRQGSLTFADAFTQVSYQLENTDFIVSGFQVLNSSVVASVGFNRVEFSDIVGNRAAKHQAIRIAKRLACYDPKARKNPFLELGEMQSVRMGYGKPGTGKSLQIAATATLAKDYCERRGIPFIFHPLPDNVVSTFQGGSAERMLDWMKRFQDDSHVVYGAIDDGENNLEERTRQGVSAGVREVIGVFLRYTEGAYAVKRGNTVLEIFTNIPEQIDRAVMSRIQARFPIDGAETVHDFMDQDYLWFRKFDKTSPGFVNMTNSSGYVFMSDQAEVRSLLDLERTAAPKEFADSRLKEIYDRVRGRLELTDHSFFAELFAAVHKEFPYFTSRDVRNIQSAVTGRVMDFDIPDEWFDKPELFFDTSFDRRVEMLREVMKGNMKGLSFAELRLRETFEYLNNMASIANVDRERSIAELIQRLEIEGEARKRFGGRTAK